MESKNVLLLILFQGIIFASVFASKEESTSHSAQFLMRANKRLKGHVVKQFESPSLLSCGQQCLRNAWCTSTNYKTSSKKDSKGTCELNKHEISLINENTEFHELEDVTFSMRLEGCLITGCLDGGSCLLNEKTEIFSSCSCKPPWTGDKCEVKLGPCTAVGVAANQYLISDDQMTATSVYLQYYAYKGRLYGDEGWCQRDEDITHDYLQVDMAAVHSVCKVATQGKKNGSWVTSYKLSFSTDGVNWNTYQEQGVDKVFQANSDLNTVVEHALNNEGQARYVRFYPRSYSTFPCMRVEVYVR